LAASFHFLLDPLGRLRRWGDNVKMGYREVVRTEGGWSWLRIISSDRLWY